MLDASEFDTADDGSVDDMVYVTKLKRSNRPRKLTAAVLLLLLLMRRVTSTAELQLRIVLTGPTLAVAKGISYYVYRKTGVTPAPAPIAEQLLEAIVKYATEAAKTLQGNALRARLGLIIQAEVQRATAAAFKSVAWQLFRITRSTTSTRPCDQCDGLAGTYTAPFPDEIWYTHPRCACVWEAA